MSISLKAELEIWDAALKAYDEQDFAKALDLFSSIADSSKILTNMGLIYATIGEHETAVEHFIAATNLDSYLAIAHFQCGVSNFLTARYDLALLNFEDAYLYLRGNEAINYEQIGLKFKLFSAEVMFNKGLAQLNLGYADSGMADLQEASKQKITDDHGVIDEAIRDRGVGYTVFSIPVGVLYRPSENKVKNSKSKDYLGKAKLVAASDSNDAFTEFTGAKKLQQALGEIPEITEDENRRNAESPTPSNNAPVPAPRTELTAPRPAAHQRSNTNPQLGSVMRPDAATILAARRTQSVSNPEDAPRPFLASDLSRNNTALSRNGSARRAGTAPNSPGVMPLRTRVPQGTPSAVASVGRTTATEETGAEVAVGAVTALQSRPNLRGPPGEGASQVAQQSAPQPPPSSLQPGQYLNPTQSTTPLVLPASPVLARGHLTKFYDTYIDAYTDEPASQLANPYSSASPALSNASSRRSSPASSSYQLSQPQPEEQLPGLRMQSVTNHAPSRSVNGGTVHVNPDLSPPRRKVTRRPTATTMRRVQAYDQEEGDGMDDYDAFEVANIRVKLHYQGDVRGMTIPSAASFNEFVERVTIKFGTSLMGLGMKFMDEDGTKISLRDESDFELAIETAKESAKGKSDGKIEVWCVDV